MVNRSQTLAACSNPGCATVRLVSPFWGVPLCLFVLIGFMRLISHDTAKLWTAFVGYRFSQV